MNKHPTTSKQPFSVKQYLASLALWCGVATAPAVYATVITFDELTQPTDDPSAPLVVDNQYAALGVIFSDAALYSDPGAPNEILETSPPNAISDFFVPWMDIYFTGPLPTTVSFYMSAGLQDALYVDAYGPAGLVGSFTSDGWQGPVLPDNPYHDQQFVTFTGAEISHLSFSDFYDRRADIIIDDLSFTRDATNIPEPSALSLCAAGFGLIFFRHKFFSK